jgi:NADPH:quinone reductase-like Zn-dependent oxidoreductase
MLLNSLKIQMIYLILRSGVNFHDTMTRNGILDNWVRSTKPPFIMGSEVAGEIVGLGKNVTDLKVTIHLSIECMKLKT